MIGKPIAALTAADLDLLVTNSVPEGHELEYKRELPSGKLDSRKEFLADVSAFANTRGGHLIYGVDEVQGVATEICGLTGIDRDKEIARLQGMLETGIEPRLVGHTIRAVDSSNGSPVIVLHIPVSWARPHVVRLEGHWRFYVRDSSGKHPLDVGELRSLFGETDAVAARARGFRAERLSRVLGGEAPLTLPEGPKLVLHVVPVQAFAPAYTVDLAPVVAKRPKPLYASSWNHRRNFDGFLTFAGSTDPNDRLPTYLQVFRNGCLESVDCYLLAPHGPRPRRIIPSTALEEELIECCALYLRTLSDLRIGPPVLIMITLLGVKGFEIAFRDSPSYDFSQHPIEKEDLLLPEILVEDLAADTARILRPAFDMLWNACGPSRSFNYDENGERIKRS